LSESTPATISLLLQRLSTGEQAVEQELYGLVYDDLRRHARGLLGMQKRDHSLQATALVHEAWLRLADHQGRPTSRAHFFRLAARAMRCVLVDHARSRAAAKRGGGAERAPIDDIEAAASGPSDTLLAIDESLTRLQAVDANLARMAELRLFAGLDHAEIARELGVSTRTIERGWRLARRWIQADLEHAG
jgi:RNA polymerase sigma factor (TIGR02999 family)